MGDNIKNTFITRFPQIEMSAGYILLGADIDPIVNWRFFHQLIVDSHLPVIKPCAVELVDNTRTLTPRVNERSSICGENIVELSANLKDIIIIPDDSAELYTPEFCRSISVSQELSLSQSGLLDHNTPLQFLYTKDVIAHFITEPDSIGGVTFLSDINPIEVRMHLKESTGYRDMASNAVSGDMQTYYFPFNTYHNLTKYIRILPFDGTTRYRLYNGMTEDIFKKLLMRFYYKAMVRPESLWKGDIKWLSKYTL